MPNVDGLWIGVQKVDEKLLIQCYGGQIDEPLNRKQQIDDNSLFIPRKYCRFVAYGGQNDKEKVYLICMKRVQKVDERGQNVLQKLR